MEFYKASLWVIGQKSNTISQKTKSTKEPYLHEQILTMEIKHELQLPANEKSEKYEHQFQNVSIMHFVLPVGLLFLLIKQRLITIKVKQVIYCIL